MLLLAPPSNKCASVKIVAGRLVCGYVMNPHPYLPFLSPPTPHPPQHPLKMNRLDLPATATHSS